MRLLCVAFARVVAHCCGILKVPPLFCTRTTKCLMLGESNSASLFCSNDSLYKLEYFAKNILFILLCDCIFKLN